MARAPERSNARAAPGSVRIPLRRGGRRSWEERCRELFDDLRKPARVMLGRSFGRALSSEEIEDVYASAWTSTLSALRGRGEQLSDTELRAYLLKAVQNHANKELRRRRRKPTVGLEDSHHEVLSDAHQASPEERAVGAERDSVARDVLASLPERRRAVILLRYGWGLKPEEICSRLDGLSPRAYRKEITRGVEQMIERLAQVESGEWCRTREPILRDLIAGVADDDAARQAREHISHCRRCAELVGRLQSELHDLGSSVGWTALAAAIGDRTPSLGERLAALGDRGREGAQRLIERGDQAGDAVGGIAAAGGTRGAGAAGVGALAKLGGLGATGKAVLACIGGGVAATACVAAGILPVGAPDRDAPDPRRTRPPAQLARPLQPAINVDAVPTADRRSPQRSAGVRGERSSKPRPDRIEVAAPQGAPPASPAPSAPPTEQEFGLPAAVGAGAGGGNGSASGSDVVREFGP